MKEEIVIQQISQLIDKLSGEIPEVFNQILLQGYIKTFMVAGLFMVLLILFIIVINLCYKDEEDLREISIFIAVMIFVVVFCFPIMELVQLYFTPKAYIIKELLH